MIAEQLSHYRILNKLGAGGMGEVYRARDERLGRDVALKLLPAEFAQNADRLRRFEQEARATSALNHPNILTIYDIGTATDGDGTGPFIVMELLEGEELRALLKAGAIAPRRAVEYARQVASGLAAAHAKGIVHRDLKPENLFLTTDGRVKILDFGLAKLRPPQVVVDSDAPTQKQITNPGAVLGTVGYMSPEQVRGQEVDHRSDIFSFGVILYEMLVGHRPFGGASAVEVMNAILKEEPPEFDGASAKVNPQLERIVRRCLEKQPGRRFQTASDLGFALESSVIPSSSSANRFEAVQALETSALAKPGGWRGRIAWLVAGALALALLSLGVAYVQRPSPETEPMRLYVNPPEKAKLFDWPTISPDGHTLAFVAEVDGKRQLWIRLLSATTARPLVEIRDGMTYPFWSPDSQFIAYFELRKLKKLALAGGEPEILCDTPIPGGGTWNHDGSILFGSGPAGIRRISANGGAITAITSVDSARGDTDHRAPSFLPDGRHFLYYIYNPDPTKNGIYLTALTGRESQRLLSVDAWNVGVALDPADQRKGYLTFTRQGALLVQSFDFSHNQLVGNPVRIAEHIATPSLWARFSLTATGTLVLLEKEADEQLTWFDRAGKKLGTVGPAGQYFNPRLSPDGQHLAVGRRSPQTQFDDIYLFDLASGAGTPFTFDPRQDERPIWSPDGSRIVWASSREGTTHLFQKAASGAGQDEALLRSAYYKQAHDWSTDGRFILYQENNPQTSADLWILPVEGERKPWPWLNTPALENLARFSPDGKWIAYRSNESRSNEIYIQAFVPGAPASSGKRQLSTQGGTYPHWRHDGRELYYVSADGKLMAVEIMPGTELKAGSPKELFTPSGYQMNGDRGYTLTGDGKRFLFVTNAEDASVPPFTVVLNWMAEVKR